MAEDSALTKTLIIQAIRSEMDGYRFYTFLAEKTAKEDVKRKLTNLAKDEVRHEALLIGIYKKLYREDVGETPKKGLGVLSQFFDHPERREKMTEIQYIDLAIEAELAATQYYKEAAEDAPNDDMKNVCREMAAEEFSHYELLQAEKEALGGKYYWFAYDDGSPLED